MHHNNRACLTYVK